MTDNTTSPTRRVQRVRHALEARLCTVLRVASLSPGIVRITLGADALQRFVSASFDDHVKLMLPPADGSPLVLPTLGPGGPDGPASPASAAGAVRPVMRDFTPRAFDTTRGELDIEFALHGHGPAAAWAAQAQPGQQVGIGGPRGSLVIPIDFDWHLLIGDETALPAIARRLEELPAGSRVFAIVKTTDPADRRELRTAANLHLQWLDAGTPGGLTAATAALTLPAGEGYAWAAGEAAEVAEVRRVLVGPHGLAKEQVRAAAYWKRGAAGHHENLGT